MAKAKKADTQIKAWHYDIVVKPVITEKSTMASEQNKVVFNVPVDANKGDIKEAVETLYKVTVTKVNTLRQQGKLKRFRGIKGRRAETKKAFVTLKQGDSIDLMTGV